MRRSTGQASLEFLLLAGLVAVLILGLGVVLASGAAASTADALRRALRPPSPAHDDTWAIGSSTWGPLIRRYAPRVVLERDVYGEDASVPVDFAHCRAKPAPASASPVRSSTSTSCGATTRPTCTTGSTTPTRARPTCPTPGSARTATTGRA